jgi:hypothetical protein
MGWQGGSAGLWARAVTAVAEGLLYWAEGGSGGGPEGGPEGSQRGVMRGYRIGLRGCPAGCGNG